MQSNFPFLNMLLQIIYCHILNKSTNIKIFEGSIAEYPRYWYRLFWKFRLFYGTPSSPQNTEHFWELLLFSQFCFMKSCVLQQLFWPGHGLHWVKVIVFNLIMILLPWVKMGEPYFLISLYRSWWEETLRTVRSCGKYRDVCTNCDACTLLIPNLRLVTRYTTSAHNKMICNC